MDGENQARENQARESQARLIQLARETSEDGVHHWSLRVIADKFVTLEGGKVSRETVRKALQASELKPWRDKEWRIPPEGNAEFVDAMERVLDVCMKEPDPAQPLVCMDESPRQLIGEIRTPIPSAPGFPARHDTEYVRNGTARLFMFTAPRGGWRRVEAAEGRSAIDLGPPNQKAG